MTILEIVISSIGAIITLAVGIVTLRNISRGEDPVLAVTKAFMFWEYLRWPSSGASTSWTSGSRQPWVSDVVRREQKQASRKADETIARFGKKRR